MRGRGLLHLKALGFHPWAHHPRRHYGSHRASAIAGGVPHLLAQHVQYIRCVGEVRRHRYIQRREGDRVQLPWGQRLVHRCLFRYRRHLGRRRDFLLPHGWLWRCTSCARLVRGRLLSGRRCFSQLGLLGLAGGLILLLLRRHADGGDGRARSRVHHFLQCICSGRCSRCTSSSIRRIVEHIIIRQA